jgi:hypothetical protein
MHDDFINEFQEHIQKLNNKSYAYFLSPEAHHSYTLMLDSDFNSIQSKYYLSYLEEKIPRQAQPLKAAMKSKKSNTGIVTKQSMFQEFLQYRKQIVINSPKEMEKNADMLDEKMLMLYQNN